jgi:hypothetical protein
MAKRALILPAVEYSSDFNCSRSMDGRGYLPRSPGARATLTKAKCCIWPRHRLTDATFTRPFAQRGGGGGMTGVSACRALFPAVRAAPVNSQARKEGRTESKLVRSLPGARQFRS